MTHVTTRILKRLAALSLPTEAFQEVLAIIAEIQSSHDCNVTAEATRREGQRQRTKKCRENKRAVTLPSRDSNVTCNVTGAEQKEIPPTPPKEKLSSLRSVSILPSSATTYEKQAKNGVCFSSETWPRDFREQFWACYPRKVGKAGAMRKLDRIRRDGKVTFETLLAAVRKYAADADPDYTKHPETWLNKGCWDDEPTSVINGHKHRFGSREDTQERTARALENLCPRFGLDADDPAGSARDVTPIAGRLPKP